ncbi:hypothetical protein B1759_09950 [Rubrivirga sp. SAORIC476]|uniref:T9SS type A sorting domain-containing protein n=1 Tax=Rubrivirga sp. SAORIC476 TaxID=1961794 RepID=UPI000BA9A98F|nr:T9SS type A sorting domain-containing protein [Rubrivirga sp. SAORIC476]PAP81618.1 hypothetical protein B1759_09950 [Rubrivirga sp. SAORIC476]
MTPLRLLLSALLLLAAPAVLAQQDLVLDGSFEGTPPLGWSETTSSATSPFCDDTCGRPPRTGAQYVFLAGLSESNDMSVAQTVTIPADATSALLTYHLQLGAGDDGSGEFAVFIDTIQLEAFTQDDAASFPDYVARNVDLSFFADGQPHTIRFVGVEVAGTTADAFFGALVDDVSLVVTTPSGGDPPVNDFAFAAYPIAASDTNKVGTLVGADIEDTFNPPASCVGAGRDGSNAVWWAFAATGVGTVEAYAGGSGADPVDTILTIHTLDSEGSLTEVACNDDRTLGSPDDGSYVTFDTVPGTRYFLRVTGYDGAEGELAVGVGGVSGLLSTFVAEAPNDNVAAAPGALVFSNAPALYPDLNIGATEEAGESVAACVAEANDGRNSVWRIFTAPGDGSVTIDWAESSFDTIGSVHVITEAGAIGEQVACNDDAPVGTRSLVTFPVTGGTSYVVRTVGFQGAEGTILQTFSFDPATASEGGAEEVGLQLTASPNPAVGAVRLAATLAEAAEVRVDVFDALGRRVAVVFDGAVSAGTSEWTWDPDGQTAGIYIVRLTADGAVRTQTVTVVR